MNVNYDNTELIAEVKQDIQEFGGEMKVYAVYSVFPEVDQPFITDYIHAEKPERDEYMTDDEYSRLIEMFNKQLATLDKTKHELMTLDRLLRALEEQNNLL